MDDTELRLVVDCASLAPSVHNTQPWRFLTVDAGLEVRADRERALSYLDPTGRQLHVSCGAAIEFARLAMHSLGRECDVTLLPGQADPDLLARLAVGEPYDPTPLDRDLVAAMPRRYTDRSPYDATPVPADLLQETRTAAEAVGVWLRVITDLAERTTLASILTDAEAAEAADPEYTDELAKWTRETSSPDGIPLAAEGREWPASAVSDMPLRDFGGRGAHPRPGGDELPPTVVRDTLVLLGTETDTPADWLATGRALGSLLLRAAAAGVSSQPLGPAIDQQPARARLRHDLRLVGHPQFLLRMGYGSGQPRTGRRSADQTLGTSDTSG